MYNIYNIYNRCYTSVISLYMMYNISLYMMYNICYRCITSVITDVKVFYIFMILKQM